MLVEIPSRRSREERANGSPNALGRKDDDSRRRTYNQLFRDIQPMRLNRLKYPEQQRPDRIDEAHPNYLLPRRERRIVTSSRNYATASCRRRARPKAWLDEFMQIVINYGDSTPSSSP